LSSINPGSTIPKKELRSFGLILAGGFLLIGLWPVVVRHQNARLWAVAIGLSFGIIGLLAPSLLRRVYPVWMMLGNALGWINSKIVLGTLFYLVITPMRVVLAIARHDPLNRTFDPDCQTYRSVRKPRPASHMNHQF
jgi:hypothetical protein